MANSILTMTAVTREALRILHQRANFLGSINRQYDPSFAKSGAKIGDSLKIRLPNRYTVRSGATIQAQDTAETSTTLQVATQKGVDMQFSSVDLTMNLDDFSKRIIEPAVNVLVAAVENDALNTMRLDIYKQVNNVAAAITVAKVLDGGRRLTDSLTPPQNRTALMNTADMANAVDTMKGLFNSQELLGKQYRDGQVGRAYGFDWAENTHLATQTRGDAASYQTNAATAQTGASLIVDVGTGTINIGEVFTIADVFRVHPETKVSTGILQQFVAVTALTAAGTFTISPSIVASGALQNVSNGAADNKAVTVMGTASTNYGQSLLYHEDAFTFATADLVMPGGVDMAAREVLDGVSLRMVRAYDINSDNFPCRLDILYGYKTIRPQLACRLANLAPA